MDEVVFLKGFSLSLSLIVAIGAQNAFIIKQAIAAREYIFIVCLLCFLCDVLLMSLGIFGIGEFLAKNLILSLAIAFCGIIFSLYYVSLSLKAVLHEHSALEIKNFDGQKSLTQTIILTLAVTLLNPQVYLDTIFLIGASAFTFNLNQKIIFLFGALCASLIWFFGLGYGVKKIRFLFLNPKIYKLVDLFVACVMLFVMWSLVEFCIENLYR